MAREEIGATFSDVWYRVSTLHPRLSPHAHIVRQQHGAHVDYIVEDPASGNFYRLSEAAHFFVGLLDGSRTVEEAWDACNEQLGDAAPTQRECVDVLSRLQLFGLLIGDAPLAADMLLERKQQSRKRRRDQRTGKWMFFSVPLVNPERFLERNRIVCRFLFSRVGFALWLLVAITGLGHVIAFSSELARSFDLASLLAPAQIASLAALFLVIRALHEFGHAAACKAFGGRVTEIGVMLIGYVLPLPYCDATSSWRFPSTLHRVVVALGGVYVELFLAAIAAVVWAHVDEDLNFVRSLCYNTMLISGVSTLLFNLNPLLRYDGYYVLSDLAGAPNLAQRSRELWRYALVRHVFGSRATRPPSIRDRAEAALLWVFNALSAPYRIFVTLAIVLIILKNYPGLGLVIAAVVIGAWFVWPALNGLAFLLGSPQLIGHRTRAISTVLITAVVGTAVLGFIPFRNSAYADGFIAPRDNAPVRTPESGYVEGILVEIGALVEVGQPLIRIRNLELEALLASARGRRAAAAAELDKAIAEGAPNRIQAAQIALRSLGAEADHLAARVDSLTIRADARGRLAPAQGTAADLQCALGQFVQAGTLLGYVLSTEDLVVRVAVSERQTAHIFRSDTALDELPVAVRIRGDAGTLTHGRVVSVVHRSSRELAAESLSTMAGGQITPDPSDPSGRRTLSPYSRVDIAPVQQPESWQPGLRSRARFELPSEPLASQWSRRFRQYLRSRL